MTVDSTRAPDGATAFTNNTPETYLSPFAMCREAFLAAQEAYERHRAICRPTKADDHEGNLAYEHAYQPLVDAWNVASVTAVRCPVDSMRDLADKLKIFRSEEIFNSEGVAELFDILIEDVNRIGGAA